MIAPIAFAILFAAIFFLKDKKKETGIRLDVTSLILSTAGFGSLLYGFSSAGSIGWDRPQVYLSIFTGIITLAAFILRQRQLADPMLDFRVYKYPMFSLSSIIMIVFNMAMFSGFMLLPIYAQSIRGMSPFESGIMLLPGALIAATMSPINGKLFDKFGGRILAVTGLIITAYASYLLSRLSFETAYFQLVLMHAIRMFDCR